MSARDGIAVVGMACRYPGAASPRELWDNALAGRRAFRRIPPERLRLEDYPGEGPDSIAVAEAALLEDWQLDRVAFRIAGASWRAADHAHWLALEVASRALDDAGCPGAEGLDRDAAGVLVGNSLTGEFSRAGLMRLRWPYVRRTVGAALAEAGWEEERRSEFLAGLEERYKAPFPEPGDETLAGGLANTIAGRIANHFDLHGGGYTVDGACASSLLAVANACSAIAAGDLEVALAGGVDLSLDPFELVGFSRTGAFARDRMRVYDARSGGFLPGEGCGFVVLVPLAAARRRGMRVHAVIRGWGLSSDGAGGLTRPEAAGQRLALERAYRRADFGPDSVAYFEGHGTGTAVGDPVELSALIDARRAALAARAGEGGGHGGGDGAGPPVPAAVSSIKAVIGHTKAAAGVAGLLEAVMALSDGVLPPNVGCDEPHPVLADGDGGAPVLRTLARAEPWPSGAPLRAGVSAFGFGGINAHVVLEAEAPRPRTGVLPEHARRLDAGRQDAELLLLAAADGAALAARAAELAGRAERLSHAELADLAAELAAGAAGGGSGAAGGPGRLGSGAVRAAVVASRPVEAAERLRALAGRLAAGEGTLIDPRAGLAAHVPVSGAAPGGARRPPRIGFLFPGQGAPGDRRAGGAWARRFADYEAVLHRAGLPADGDGVATEIAQPAIAAASLGALAVLDRLGVQASVAVGHSLGELVALAWAGAFDGEALLRLARARGAAMAAVPGDGGAMASLACTVEEAEEIVAATDRPGESVVVAGHNTPRQTVISGPAAAVAAATERARAHGVAASRLRVSHAFHSPAMAAAAPALARALAAEELRAPARPVLSTILGGPWPEDADPAALLVRQLTAPVRFTEALAAAGDVDLWIEVGPGRVTTELARRCGAAPAVALDAGGPSLAGLLGAVGSAWALGAPVAVEELFRDRHLRPLVEHTFLANPCEAAPVDGAAPAGAPPRDAEEDPARAAAGASAADTPAAIPAAASMPPLELVRSLVAHRAELPSEAVAEGHRMLSDLHLSSIAVGQLVLAAARRLGAPPPASPTDYADASVGEIAAALAAAAQANGGGAVREEGPPPGVDSWVRAFRRELVPAPAPAGEAYAAPFEVLAPAADPLAAALAGRLGAGDGANGGAGAGGLLVVLPEDLAAADLDRLLAAGRAALAQRERRLVLVHRAGGAGFARTLHLERGGGEAVVVEVPPLESAAEAGAAGVEALAAAVAAEARGPVGSRGYGEAVYDAALRRHVPRLVALPPAPQAAAAAPPLGAGDVLLVTGGGRGIAAECALELARASGAALALVGRSAPEASPELAENLERFAAAGVRFVYRQADVTDRDAIRAAVAEIRRELGPVTGVLHGAGRNQPRLVAALTAEEMAATLAVKVDGLAHVLAAVDASHLRLLVAFGSIIAEIGVRGEADYALANERLARAVERFAAAHPACRCLTAEWSVWSGVGMGERLGTLESLLAQGITPIPLDRGVAELAALLGRAAAEPDLPATLVVAGRFGDPPTVDLARPELPFLRFLETARFHVPGVELVVECELSDASDPYVADHVFHGERLFPAVLGLEAMLQAAVALTGRPFPPAAGGAAPAWSFEDVRFEHPVSVPLGERVTLRVAALVRDAERVEVVLRSSASGFQRDHFGAVCRFAPVLARPAAASDPAVAAAPVPLAEEPGGVALDPAVDLYGGVLFHAGRFRRLAGYRRLRATECAAEISADGAAAWFARHLPADLLLGDPGARDAAIHAVQASIPHATVLPTGVARLVPGRLDAGAVHRVEAREVARDGRDLVYDLALFDAAGRLVERWEGLGLRAVADRPAPAAWPLPLVAPHVERRLGDLVPGARPSVALLHALTEGEDGGAVAAGGRLAAGEEPAGANGDHAAADGGSPAASDGRRSASDRAVAAAVGRPVVRFRRPDGRRTEARPGDGADAGALSVSHAAGLVLAVAGGEAVGCDLEPVAPRAAEDWRDLLGRERASLAEVLATEVGESLDAAATRVWSAGEALKKLGDPVDAPLTLVQGAADGWVLLASGERRVAVLVARVRGVEAPLALAVALPAAAASRSDPAGLVPMPDAAAEAPAGARAAESGSGGRRRAS